MRAPPPVEISLGRLGQGRAFVVAVASLTAVVDAVWIVLADRPWNSAASVAIAGLALAAVALALSSFRPCASSLRWNGARWHLDFVAPGHESDEGDVFVAIDLGPWMLLRFVSGTAVGGRRRVTWLPVQRRGLEARWHGLRCALYAPRPASEAS